MDDFRGATSIRSLLKPNIKTLIFVTISGIIFDVGLVAIPLFEGWLAQRLYEIMRGEVFFRDMLNLVLTYLAVMLIVQVSRYFKRFFVRRFSNDLIIRMRKKLYHKIVWTKNFDEQSLGEMTTRAVSDIDAVAEGMRKLATEIFDTGVLFISYEVTLFILDYRIALIGLIFTPIGFVLARLVRKPVYKSVSDSKKSAEALTNGTFSRVSNAILYRVYGRERAEKNSYEKLLADYEKTSVKANFWQNTLQPLYNITAMIGVIFIIYFGSKNVLGTGFTLWADIASLVTFVSCYAKVSDKSSKGAKLINSLQKARVCWLRLKPVLNSPDNEYIDSLNKNKKVECLELNNASFSYGDNCIFSKLFLKAKIGEVVGVTGPVASGKSTFGKMFLCEAPYGGSILLDGKELSSYTDEKLLDKISYLGHNPELMSFSLEENICLGDKCNVEKLLQTVRLSDEIQEMNNNVETFAGNAGTRLSGGQQSRLALARTLAHLKGLVILDDPFSAVDKKTEIEITEELKDLLKDNIVIFISHRLRAFPEFSKIIWIDNGKATVSTHSELMKDNAAYRELFLLQSEGGAV